MHCFLGIVLQEDIQNDFIHPAFVLCRRTNKKNNKVVHYLKKISKEKMDEKNKVIFKSYYGNSEFIEFLSNFRIQVKVNNKIIKYFPKGALFWFECDKNGKGTGTSVFIKTIPERIIKKIEDCDRQYEILSKKIKDKNKLNNILSNDFRQYSLEESNKRKSFEKTKYYKNKRR